jgi:hypothetical protein
MRARTCSTGLGELGCPDELNDLILGHVKRGVLAHYDYSKRIPERADWLRRTRRLEEMLRRAPRPPRPSSPPRLLRSKT